MAATIEPRQDELNRIYFEIFGTNEERRQATRPDPGPEMADDALILKAKMAKNGNEFESLWYGSTLGYNGDDSAADMALMNHLAFWTRGNATQMDRLFSLSGLGQRDKWRDRSDYRDRTIQKAISDATGLYEPPKDEGNGKSKAEEISLEEIETGFKEDPDSITTFKSLAILRRLSPLKQAGFFKKVGITGDQKKILLDLLNPIEESTPKEIDPIIRAEAERILGEGKAFEYVLQVWQKRHHGDENLGKALLLSIGAQSCVSSKGVHVHACGPRGLGKSDGTEKASEAIPPSHLLVGSASPKALYYLGERLPAGSVVYLDDIGWNDQAAQMFKTCTTFYKDGATHTVESFEKLINRNTYILLIL